MQDIAIWKIYFSKQISAPKRYVSSEILCTKSVTNKGIYSWKKICLLMTTNMPRNLKFSALFPIRHDWKHFCIYGWNKFAKLNQKSAPHAQKNLQYPLSNMAKILLRFSVKKFNICGCPKSTMLISFSWLTSSSSHGEMITSNVSSTKGLSTKSAISKLWNSKFCESKGLPNPFLLHTLDLWRGMRWMLECFPHHACLPYS